jgi:hypothetical protein
LRRAHRGGAPPGHSLDARLHHLQGKTEFVTPPELLALLQDFHRDTLQLMLARQANARSVADYDANNAYQQVLGRQDVHLRWLADAIASLGGSVQNSPSGEVPNPAAQKNQAQQLLESDAGAQRDFLNRWTPRVAAVTNARHRKMLELIVGEMREHLRAFQQAVEGRTDVLGRHADGKVLSGGVLPARPRG